MERGDHQSPKWNCAVLRAFPKRAIGEDIILHHLTMRTMIVSSHIFISRRVFRSVSTGIMSLNTWFGFIQKNIIKIQLALVNFPNGTELRSISKLYYLATVSLLNDRDPQHHLYPEVDDRCSKYDLRMFIHLCVIRNRTKMSPSAKG